MSELDALRGYFFEGVKIIIVAVQGTTFTIVATARLARAETRKCALAFGQTYRVARVQARRPFTIPAAVITIRAFTLSVGFHSFSSRRRARALRPRVEVLVRLGVRFCRCFQRAPAIPVAVVVDEAHAPDIGLSIGLARRAARNEVRGIRRGGAAVHRHADAVSPDGLVRGLCERRLRASRIRPPLIVTVANRGRHGV